eukprot:3481597-Pyramimonas_sp.AAC.1
MPAKTYGTTPPLGFILASVMLAALAWGLPYPPSHSESRASRPCRSAVRCTPAQVHHQAT